MEVQQTISPTEGLVDPIEENGPAISSKDQCAARDDDTLEAISRGSC